VLSSTRLAAALPGTNSIRSAGPASAGNFRAQRIPEKTAAMTLWSDALLKAFFAAGGIYPD
jgi:hypothetical protein